MSLGTIIWILTVLMCGIFLYVSVKVKDTAQSSFSNYAIGGKNFPLYLLLFTQLATIMGVGNFIGHAGKGYQIGLPWLAFILGEQGSKIIFALVFAGLAGRFSFNTFPEMIDNLFVNDKITRAFGGILASMIMIAWVGGQGKAFGNIFNIVTGADPIPIILVFSAIFILYTTLGGIHSVVWTDLIQGILVVFFGAAFYFYAFSPVHWSLAELGVRLAEVGKAEMWTFTHTDPIGLLSKFVTGCIGILVVQAYWQRCFSAKNSKTARNAMLFSGFIAIFMVMLTAFVGMVILTLNQNLSPDDAMPWFMLNYVPVWISAMIFVLILAAGMSSADSSLNSAAVLIVNDIIRPFKEKASDDDLVKYAKILTICIGVFSALAGIYASSILGLFSKAYAIAGGGLVPLLIVGISWKKDKNADFEEGKANSNITPWGARTGVIVGSVLTQVTALGANRVLIALVASTVCIIVVSILTKEPAQNKAS
ncbi:sodium:solute symporter family protein [Anaeromicrobium sediminis]|uniref:Sodium:solute symporter n=1 Tax=Anaeromicrobium sediminis TaxID=1478221 RepID=A0A267MJL0_9FIRM|nr:sodium:solute symporter family protein [Anaeromicrobium sediminis]PAB59784.1 sodium:solute symporter [Anaeromicrobium sediminis]